MKIMELGARHEYADASRMETIANNYTERGQGDSITRNLKYRVEGREIAKASCDIVNNNFVTNWNDVIPAYSDIRMSPMRHTVDPYLPYYSGPYSVEELELARFKILQCLDNSNNAFWKHLKLKIGVLENGARVQWSDEVYY